MQLCSDSKNAFAMIKKINLIQYGNIINGDGWSLNEDILSGERKENALLNWNYV